MRGEEGGENAWGESRVEGEGGERREGRRGGEDRFRIPLEASEYTRPLYVIFGSICNKGVKITGRGDLWCGVRGAGS